MNELSTLAKFIYNTAINDADYFAHFGTRFREEVLPNGLDVTQPVAMFVGVSHRDIKGAYGQRLYTKDVYHIKGVVEGDDFSLLGNCADDIDRLFDWQNQIDSSAGRPRSQQLYTDPDNTTVQLMIMSMVRTAPLKYCTYTDGVNYCHLGGEYEIQYYLASPPTQLVVPFVSLDPIVTTSGTLTKPVVNGFAYYFDTSLGTLTETLFKATGSRFSYTLSNTGPNPVIVNLQPGDILQGTLSSYNIPSYGSITLTDYDTGKWTITMAFNPSTPSSAVDYVAVSAALAIASMPTKKTAYECDTTTAGFAVTLPPAEGEDIELIFDNVKGANNVTLVLNGTDTADATLPVIVPGASYIMRSYAAGKWAIN